MSEGLEFRDLSPYLGALAADDHVWLAQVSHLDPRDYRIGVGADGSDDEEWSPLIERGRDGHWWAGRHIGSVTVGGRRLTIEPRLGVNVIEGWLDQAFGLSAPPASSTRRDTETFIVRLLARLWCRSIDHATRHGLPLLRIARRHDGIYLRGRLDVSRTIDLMASGRQAVASTTYERSLAHPATRAIVCAHYALASRLARSGEWRTARVRQVLPLLAASVGSRPQLPSITDLSRVRYTPITLPFKRAALLSHRIASRLGYGVTDETGADEGLLIDVAELWELFVLNCARQSAPPALRVVHGTTLGDDAFLLRSITADRQLGRLKPDILVFDDETVVAVLDAKYKRLVDSRERPSGVDPADLYQIVAYANRFNPRNGAALAYPRAGEEDQIPSTAELFGPWERDGRRFAFLRLPTDVAGCAQALSEAFWTGAAPSSSAYAGAKTDSRSV